MRSIASAALVLILTSAAFTQQPQPDPEPLPLPPPPTAKGIPLKAPKEIEQPKIEEVAAITKLMRDMALKHMPNPLVKANHGWGKQKEFAVGKVMLRNPNKVGPELPREMFNDGMWRRFTVTAREPAETLGIGISELVRPAEDTMFVTINVAMDINFRMEQQLWRRGLQLYSGETRGHCKGGVQLKAQVVHKVDFKAGLLLPEITLKITTTEAKLFYDKLVIDHTAGLDGEDAKAMGDLVIDLVKAMKPDLEKELLEKGNAAILKAAGTKEIKLQLDKLAKAGVTVKPVTK
jgi:hypothetical protein